MTDYTVKYIDKSGDFQEFKTAGKDVQHAINTVIELCPDCRRVTSCTPSPMFEE